MTERETCPVCGNPDAASRHCVDDTYGDYYMAHCGKCGWEYDGLEALISDSEDEGAEYDWNRRHL